MKYFKKIIPRRHLDASQGSERVVAVAMRPINQDSPHPLSTFTLPNLGNDVNDLIAKSPSLHRDLAQLDWQGWVFKYGETRQHANVSIPTKTISVDKKKKGNPAQVISSLSNAIGQIAHEPRQYASLEDIVLCHIEQLGRGVINEIQVQREILSNGGPDVLPGLDKDKANWNEKYDHYLNSKRTHSDRETIGMATLDIDAITKSPEYYKQAYNVFVRGSHPQSCLPPRKASEFMSTGLGEEVDELVKKSPSLVSGILQLHREKWLISYGEDGVGSHCDKSAKTIIIDKKDARNTEDIADTLAHEVGHALHKQPPRLHSKEAYVNDRLVDEAAAVLHAMNARVEMTSNGEKHLHLKTPTSFSNSTELKLHHSRLMRDGKVNAVYEAVAAEIRPIAINPASGKPATVLYADQYDRLPKFLVQKAKFKNNIKTNSTESQKTQSKDFER